MRDLVTHVAIIDEAFVAAADRPERVHRRRLRRGAITAAQLPETADWSFEQIRDRVRAGRVPRSSTSTRSARDDARVGGYSRVVGARDPRVRDVDALPRHRASRPSRPEPPAEPPVLRTMADLAVQTLPLALAAARATPTRAAPRASC